MAIRDFFRSFRKDNFYDGFDVPYRTVATLVFESNKPNSPEGFLVWYICKESKSKDYRDFVFNTNSDKSSKIDPKGNLMYALYIEPWLNFEMSNEDLIKLEKEFSSEIKNNLTNRLKQINISYSK